jgi:glucokinase
METIGIDIGGTHVRAARVSAGGDILARARAASSPDPQTMVAICRALSEKVRGDARALGIGVPGQVDAAAHRVLSGGYVDLSSIPFAALMEEATGLPAVIENDATMALLAEQAHGAARDMAHVAMLTIGTGIGGAILADGRVLRGRATAGQLGHLVVDPGGRACVCGRRGCVETVSAGTAFAIHLAEAGLPPATRAEDLLARTDDPAARQVLDRWARPLRAAIDSLITMLNPEAVVIGGGAGPAMVQALDRVPPAKSWFHAPVLGAALGDDAGVIGAAAAARGAGETAAGARAKRLIMVNGVPASGKSSIARAVADATGWPVLSLDTVKTPFLQELAPVDRLMNRRLGRASYAAIFDLIAAASPGATFIMDAWFGFQPDTVLDEGLIRAGVTQIQEIWCAVPPEVAGARYGARVADRPAGHPGLDYVPELTALVERAHPMARGPVIRIDTTTPLDLPRLMAWLEAQNRVSG